MYRRHRITCHILLSLILIIVFCNISFAKEKITWPFVCFKPLYICENNQLVDGAGLHVLELMTRSLPQYEHEILLMPIKRILESAKNKENILFYGLYKTAEREKFLEYSLPCRISTPKYIVIRKEDRPKYGDGNLVSLEKLLLDQTKMFLHLKSVSFGKGIDELLEKHQGALNFMTEYDTSFMIEKSLKLLLNKRVDYMLSLDGTGYDARELGLDHKISWLPIKEQNHYDAGYIIAPKNEWGSTAIARVNEVLKKEVPTEAFFQFFVPLVDEAMVPELKKRYNDIIVTPYQK